jgi:hypothetical protein
MSQVSPGWYPDPSGRFVQRYHDGTRWTEHVADAHGNRDTDVPSRPGRPASYPDAAPDHGERDQRSSDVYGRRSASAQSGYGQGPGEQGYGHEATRSDRGYGQEATRPDRGYGQEATRPDRDYGQEATRPDRGFGQEATRPDRGRRQWGAQEQGWDQEPAASDQRYGEQGGENRWDQAGTGSWQGHAGGPGAGDELPHDRGTGQQGRDGWAGDAAGGWGGRYQYGQQGGYAPAPAYGQQGYGDARSRSSHAFTPTIGLVVAGVGAVLLLLSLFGLNFLELSFPGLSRSLSLGDIAGDFGDGAPAALATYADFGRFLAILVAVLAVLAVARVVPQLRDISALPAIVAVACGAFALWHVLAMLASGEEGVDVSPTFGAILGLLGYVALAAGPFLRRPLQAQRQGGG